LPDNPKVEKALKPSRDSWFKRAMRLFDRPTVDEAVWEELEELLISADVGFETTEKLLDKVRQRAKEEKLKEGSAVRDALQREMVAMLTVEAQPPAPASPPEVILAVGVNGSGKTTSIWAPSWVLMLLPTSPALMPGRWSLMPWRRPAAAALTR
jgi:fused signal recognition particle receptor